MALNASTVLLALLIDFLLACILLLIFSILRAATSTGYFYEPNRRLRWSPSTSASAGGAGDSHKALHSGEDGKCCDQQPLLQQGCQQAPELPNGILGWAIGAARLPESEILRVAGLDVAVYLRLLKLGVRCTFLLTLWCCAVVLPVNVTGGALDALLDGDGKGHHHDDRDTVRGLPLTRALLGVIHPSTVHKAVQLIKSIPQPLPPSPDPGSSSRYEFTDFDKLSLSNVAGGSSRLWVHLASMFVVTALVLHLLWKECKEISALHVAARATAMACNTLSSSESDQETSSTDRPKTTPSCESVVARTVLITDIPGTPSGTPMSALQNLLWYATLLRLLPRPWRLKLAAKVERTLGDTAETVAGLLSAVMPRAKNQGGREAGDVDQPPAGTQNIQAGGAPSDIEGTTPRYGEDVALTTPLLEGRSLASTAARVWNEGSANKLVPDLNGQHHAVQLLRSGVSFPDMVYHELCEIFGRDQIKGLVVLPQLDHIKPQVRAYRKARNELHSLLNTYGNKLAHRKRFQRIQLHVDPCEVGPWAVELYGRQPLRVDALRFRLAAIQHARQQLEAARPSAAVTAPITARLHGEDQSIAPDDASTTRTDNDTEEFYDAQDSSIGALQSKQFSEHSRVPSTDALGPSGKDDSQAPDHMAIRIPPQDWKADAAQYQPTAFVTFSSRFMASVATSCPLAHDRHLWRVHPAEDASDMLWPALGHRMWYRQLKGLSLWTAYWTIVLLYVIPVSALQGLLQIQRLEQLPILQQLLQVAVIRSLVSGILPGLALRLLVAVMPFALAAMVKSSGTVVSGREVDARVTTLYFMFQIATVFLSSFVAGTLFNVLAQFVENPPSVLTVLGAGAPQVASFFILYIIFNGLVSQPLAQLRLFDLIVYSIRYRMMATSRRAQMWLRSRQKTAFGALLPYHTVCLLLVLVFCNIHPLIAPAGLIYMSLVWLLERYQHIYVWRAIPHVNSGSQLWRQIFLQIMVGLYISQLTLAGLLGIKRFRYTPLLLVPLVVTTIFHHAASDLFFPKNWQALALQDARWLDAHEAATASKKRGSKEEEQQSYKGVGNWGETAVCYQVPELVLGEELVHHAALVQEAEDLEEVLQERTMSDPVPQQVAHFRANYQA